MDKHQELHDLIDNLTPDGIIVLDIKHLPTILKWFQMIEDWIFEDGAPDYKLDTKRYIGLFPVQYSIFKLVDVVVVTFSYDIDKGL